MSQSTEQYFNDMRRALERLEATLARSSNVFRPRVGPFENVAPETIAFTHLSHDLRELGLLLALFLRQQQGDLQQARERVIAMARGQEPQPLAAAADAFLSTDVLKVYAKALHHWLYSIDDLLRKSASLNAFYSSSLQKQMEMALAYRHHMIVHKNRMESHSMDHVMPAANPEEFRLLSVPYAFRPDVLPGFYDLYRRAFPAAKIDETGPQTNISGMVQALVDGQEAMAPEIRRDVRVFLSKHGTCSVSMNMLADLAPKIAEEVLLPAAEALQSRADLA